MTISTVLPGLELCMPRTAWPPIACVGDAE